MFIATWTYFKLNWTFFKVNWTPFNLKCKKCSQNEELSFREKFEDKIYMKTVENFYFRVLVGSP